MKSEILELIAEKCGTERVLLENAVQRVADGETKDLTDSYVSGVIWTLEGLGIITALQRKQALDALFDMWLDAQRGGENHAKEEA